MMPRKIIFLSLTIILYSIAFIEGWKDKDREKSISIIQDSNTYVDIHSQTQEEIIFKENFVNDESTGTISHVSSIAPLDRNRLIAVWYSGSREGAKDVAIFMAIYDESKNSWSKPIRLVDREIASRELKRYVKKVGNPMLMRDSSGRIWLFYSSIIAGGWSGSSINYKTTLDGIEWTESRKLLLSPFFNLTHNVKNDGINLSDGMILIPCYSELFKKTSSLIWLNKETNQFKIQRITTGTDIIQPVFVPDGKDRLMIFFRNTERKREKFIKSVEMDLKNNSFSEVKSTELPNPNSGFDMIRLGDTTILAVINNSFTNRENLSIFISFDNGKRWRLLKTLEDSPGKEYSYPSITKSLIGLYHISYTHERKRIKHVIFNERWVKDQIGEDFLTLNPESPEALGPKTHLSTNPSFHNITQAIVLTFGCILLVSVIIKYLMGTLGIRLRTPLIILTSAILIFIPQPFGNISVKGLILSINPWFSLGGILCMLYILSKGMKNLLSQREASFVFIWTFLISFLLGLSIFGFVRFDLYSYGYNPSIFFIVLFLINIYLSALGSPISIVFNLYIITYILKITPSGNIFDAITDGIAFIISTIFLLRLVWSLKTKDQRLGFKKEVLQ